MPERLTVTEPYRTTVRGRRCGVDVEGRGEGFFLRSTRCSSVHGATAGALPRAAFGPLPLLCLLLWGTTHTPPHTLTPVAV